MPLPRVAKRAMQIGACAVAAPILGDLLSNWLAGPGVAAGEGTPQASWPESSCPRGEASPEDSKDGPRRLLVIYGASGPTGVALTRAALEAGYAVRAFVRDPGKLERGLNEPTMPEHLEVVQGDLADLVAVRAAVAGAHVVISVAGSKPEWNPGPMTAAVPAMVEGCREHGVRKLIVQGGALSQVPRERWRLFTEGNLVRSVLKYRYGFTTMDDNDRVIKYLYDNVRDIRWVISRPPGIEHGPRRGALAPNVDPFKATAIRYLDLADWTLAQVESDAYVGKMPRLYYPPVQSAL